MSEQLSLDLVRVFPSHRPEQNRSRVSAWRKEFKARDPEGFREWDGRRQRRVRAKMKDTNDLDRKKKYVISNVRARAKIRGIHFDLRIEDVVWSETCPVLGIKLNYFSGPEGGAPNSPSLDRWDNAKGYVPGNVFVISKRANALKSNGTADELMRVALYASKGLSA